MGKTISIYLNDDLLRMLESSGANPSSTIQNALKNYFLPGDRKAAFDLVAEIAKDLGETHTCNTVIDEWISERDNDTW
jgi:hypothetical protein